MRTESGGLDSNASYPTLPYHCYILHCSTIRNCTFVQFVAYISHMLYIEAALLLSW